ncbi:hypothetical protein LCGC14_1027380 [marine sediment metagenome]|uniref:Uncharacterized protein n=1 Tax=marine sediment metagenome TaxID=412755 RepID=A0A0F9QDS5_9ZZZZ
MKWLLLGAILVFVPLSAEAKKGEITPIECSVIELRSYGFVKCRYRPDPQQWRLVYKPLAYKQVIDSGQYGAMLRTLCNAYGDSIHETNHGIFGGWQREIKCDKVLRVRWGWR